CCPRHLENLARSHRPEALAWQAPRIERGVQRLDGLLDALVGQLEGAPVMTGHMRGIAEQHALDRLVRVLVLRLHEPLWLIGAERQVGEAEAAVLFAGRAVVDTAVE